MDVKFMETSLFNDQIHIKGFKKDGKLAYEHVCTTDEWYDGHNFLLDDEDSVRAFYHINRLEGIRYDAEGAEGERWQNLYSDTGELRESTSWFSDGTLNHLDVAEMYPYLWSSV